MGGALARAVARKFAGKATLLLCDRDREKAKALAAEIGGEAAGADALCDADFVFLGVKPNILPAVLAETAPVCRENTVLISMAAGVSLAKIEAALGAAQNPVIRIMPNTPASIGRGVISYVANDRVTPAQKDTFTAMLAEAGELHELPERLIDAASAVAGCGPAFAYLFIEAMADGGVECGLPRAEALALAAETVRGAAEMVLQSGKHPGLLKDEVCSPGGSTIVGVHALEDAAFRSAVQDAVCAAYERTRELGK